MSAIDQVISDNKAFSRNFSPHKLPVEPARKLAVIACMDYRINIELVLGLKNGDANIIRNAGGLVTEDALRSLLISTNLLGVEEVMIINHTECGMQKFNDIEMMDRLECKFGTSAVAPGAFLAFTDLELNVRRQMKRVKSHPWIPQDLIVRGFIYDVNTGLIREIN